MVSLRWNSTGQQITSDNATKSFRGATADHAWMKDQAMCAENLLYFTQACFNSIVANTEDAKVIDVHIVT